MRITYNKYSDELVVELNDDYDSLRTVRICDDVDFIQEYDNVKKIVVKNFSDVVHKLLVKE